MENTLKINVFIKSILFWKYLRKGRSDLNEILFGNQWLSCELNFKTLWRSVHKCAHTSCKRVHARFIASARVFDSRPCQYCFANISPTKAWIFMKFNIANIYYLISLSFKFHEDLCINASTRVVNVRTHVLSQVREFMTHAHALCAWIFI